MATEDTCQLAKRLIRDSTELALPCEARDAALWVHKALTCLEHEAQKVIAQCLTTVDPEVHMGPEYHSAWCGEKRDRELVMEEWHEKARLVLRNMHIEHYVIQRFMI